MLPQRIVLAIMAFLGVAVFFAMRVSIFIALTEMVKPIEPKNLKNNTAVCAAVTLITANSTNNSLTTRNKGTQYSWTQEEQGFGLYE